MPGKVFHVSDDLHRQTKAFCEHHGLGTKPWVEAVIQRALLLGVTDSDAMIVAELKPAGPPVQIPAQLLDPQDRPAIVPKKPLEVPLPDQPEQVPPWERAPFWVGKDAGESHGD